MIYIESNSIVKFMNALEFLNRVLPPNNQDAEHTTDQHDSNPMFSDLALFPFFYKQICHHIDCLASLLYNIFLASHGSANSYLSALKHLHMMQYQ